MLPRRRLLPAPPPAGAAAVPGSELGVSKPRTAELHIGALAFIPQENRVIAAYARDDSFPMPPHDNSFAVGIFSLDDGQQRVVCQGHSAVINDLAVSPDRRWIISASDDGTARLWSSADGHELCCLPWKRAHYTRPLPGGPLPGVGPNQVPPAASCARPCAAPVGARAAPAQSHRQPDARVSPVRSLCRDATSRGGRAIRRAGLGNSRNAPEKPVRWRLSPVTSVAIAPKGTRVALGTQAGAVGVFDVPSGDARWMAIVSSPVDRLTFSPDGRYLVVRTSRAFHVADARTGQIAESHSRSNAVWSVAFAPDGKRVVAGGDDAQVRLFDTARGKLSEQLDGPHQGIDTVAVSPGRGDVIAHSADGFFWRWDGRRVRRGPLARRLRDTGTNPGRGTGAGDTEGMGDARSAAAFAACPLRATRPSAATSPWRPCRTARPGRERGPVRASFVSDADPAAPSLPAADDDDEGPRAYLGHKIGESLFGARHAGNLQL